MVKMIFWSSNWASE